MCKKPKGIHNRIDKCMKPLINFLNEEGYETLACCCGHGKYPITIVVKSELYVSERGPGFELLHKVWIRRKKRFYTKDKQGYYFIPEVIEKCK